MKSLLKSLLIFIFFIFALLIFLPKENLYYFALKKAYEEKIFVNSKSIKDDGLSLSIQKSIIYYDDIQALKVENINLNLYLIHNTINIYDIALDDMLRQFLPSKIKSLEISHSILNPLVVDIKANLVQAKAYGSFDILTNTISLNIKPSKQFLVLYKKLLKNMKKLENGEYQIEYKL